MKTLLFGAVIAMIAVSPALAGGARDTDEQSCKSCPSWRSPASDAAPPVVGWANFPEDRLRVCHLVKEQVGTRHGHPVYQTRQVCG
jgi:hypothetical protein